MNEQDNERALSGEQTLIERMRSVTISREYGSGGGEIARRLAERLSWQLIDHEVVVRLAQKLGISEVEAAAYDEHASTLIGRMLTSMSAIDPAVLMGVPGAVMTSEQAYHQALHQVVEAAARERHTVIVGRGGQVVLSRLRDVLHVRIVAPIEQRVMYVMQREGLDRDSARARIQLKDRDRMRYLRGQYHVDSSDAHLYDLVLNTGVIDLDGIVALICQALQRKATRLSVLEHELGAAAGAARYPGQPGDFRPPASLQA